MKHDLRQDTIFRKITDRFLKMKCVILALLKFAKSDFNEILYDIFLKNFVSDAYVLHLHLSVVESN